MSGPRTFRAVVAICVLLGFIVGATFVVDVSLKWDALQATGEIRQRCELIQYRQMSISDAVDYLSRYPSLDVSVSGHGSGEDGWEEVVIRETDVPWLRGLVGPYGVGVIRFEKGKPVRIMVYSYSAAL